MNLDTQSNLVSELGIDAIIAIARKHMFSNNPWGLQKFIKSLRPNHILKKDDKKKIGFNKYYIYLYHMDNDQYSGYIAIGDSEIKAMKRLLEMVVSDTVEKYLRKNE